MQYVATLRPNPYTYSRCSVEANIRQAKTLFNKKKSPVGISKNLPGQE